MSKLFIYVGVVCIVSFVSAYDWTDSDFNNILHTDLLEDFEFLDEDVVPVNYRVTRDVEKPQKLERAPGPGECAPGPAPPGVPGGPGSMENSFRYQRACCGDRDDLKMHGEALKELRKECFKEIKKARKSKAEESEPIDMFNCDKVSKMKDDTICAMECVARKKKLVDTRGNILPKNATSFVKDELVTKDWQKEIIDGVLEKCLKNYCDEGMQSACKCKASGSHPIVAGSILCKQNAEPEGNSTVEVVDSRKAKQEKPESKCNSSSLKFSHCIWREMQLSCPKDLVRNTKACDRMRERLQKKEYPDFDRRGRPKPNRPERPNPNNTKKEGKPEE